MANSKFEDAVALYQFDDKLTQKVFEGIRTIEISLRSEIGHILGKVSALAHCAPSCLSPEFTKLNSGRPRGLLHADWAKSEHAKWLAQVDKEDKRSSDVFIDHFEAKYGRPLPVWVITEILSFGTLATLFSGIKQNSRERLAVSYRIVDDQYLGDGSTMTNWINHLRYIRNVCAHHSRLWNRNITSQLGAPPKGVKELAHLGNADRSRVYSSLAVIAYLLEKFQPQELGLILRSNEAPKKRLDYLRYLRKKRQLMGIQVTKTFEYPAFQIDKSSQKILDCVARANENLLAVPDDSDDATLLALKWWLTPVTPNGLTPKELFEQGRLTPEQVDDLLPGSAP